MDGWKMKFPFDIAYFQVRTVTFREGNFTSIWDWCQNEKKYKNSK